MRVRGAQWESVGLSRAQCTMYIHPFLSGSQLIPNKELNESKSKAFGLKNRL